MKNAKIYKFNSFQTNKKIDKPYVNLMLVIQNTVSLRICNCINIFMLPPLQIPRLKTVRLLYIALGTQM